MRILLTDDEVLALASGTNRAWPFSLLTVADDEDACRAAVFRGLRSLIVRELAVVADSATTVVDPELADLIARICRSEHMVIAHVAPPGRAAIAGASVAVHIDDAGTIVDTATAMGVHAIETADRAAARETLIAFARTRLAPPRELAMAPTSSVLVARSDEDRVLQIGTDEVRSGRVVVDDGAERFVADPDSTDLGALDEYVDDALTDRAEG